VPVSNAPPRVRPWDDYPADGERMQPPPAPMRSPPPLARHRSARHGPSEQHAEPPPGRPAAEASPLRDDSEDPVGLGERSRRRVERLEEAMPLLIAAVGCSAITVALRISTATATVGRMEIWGLFAALAVIAGMGAAASMLVDESDETDSTVERPVPLSASPPATAARPVRRPALASTVPVRPDPIAPRPNVEPYGAPIWAELESEAGGSFEGDADLPAVAARPPARRGAPIPEGVNPSEAIAEIDGLWSDLERLRRGDLRRSLA
jgi:hypothetical protein